MDNIFIYDHFYILILALIDNKIPPSYSTRLSFLLSSVLYNSQYFFNHNIKLFDDFPSNEILINIIEKESYIISIGFYTLKIINNNYFKKKDIINDYIHKNSQHIIDNNEMSSLLEIINQYLENRYIDGWDTEYDLNNLPNGDIRLKLNEIQDLFTFPNPFNWTPIDEQKPIGGTFGSVKPPLNINEFIEKISSDFFDNVNLNADTLYNFQKSLTLTEKEKCVAQFWEGSTINPPMLWIFFMIYMFKNNHHSIFQLTKGIFDGMIDSFFYLSTTLFITSIIVWKFKFQKLQARPIQLIRMINNVEIDYYYGKTISNLWKPYISTPPFPDIMSGHATYSSSSSFVFNKLFGKNINNRLVIDKFNCRLINQLLPQCNTDFIDFNKFIFPIGTLIYYDTKLKEECIFEFETWNDISFDCAMSRFYGGIHFYSSNQLGLNLGKIIFDTIDNQLIL
jgi:hypothetical protein